MKTMTLKTIFVALVLFVVPFAAIADDFAKGTTVIRVALTVEKQTVRTGPYARFAQKYLGVVAPLSDKQIYTIKSAAMIDSRFDVSTSSGLAESISEPVAMSQTRNDADFVKVPVDRHDLIARSPEDAAKDAAGMIFNIRKQRMDLISGTAGENVFGAGLPAALAELERLEGEYIALFMGKQTIQTSVKVYNIVPVQGETSRVVCRFTDSGGLLPDSDLSGSPIILEMKPLSPPSPVMGAGKKSSQTVYQMVPAQVNCRLLDGKNELASEQIFITQMGVMIEVPSSGR